MTGARAEFRVFGHGIIDIVQSHMWNGRTVLQQSRSMPPETYVLSRAGGTANVKVRDAKLDIKTRVGDTEDGYQIYRPLAKCAFPLTATDMATAAGSLGIQWLDGPRDSNVPYDAFLAMSAAHPDLTLVTVTKARFGFAIDGVVCEYARVYFNGAMVETACVESEHHELMTSVIEGLGLKGLENTNYLDQALRLVGLQRHALVAGRC
jgi:hypothetical protein